MSIIARRGSVFRNVLARITGTSQYRQISTDVEPSTVPSAITYDEYFRKCETAVTTYSKHVDEVVHRWETCNEIYYGKERDFKNYPTVKQQVLHPKVRLGFIPDAWFHTLYDKTGVTGPYMLMIGGMIFLLSKEILVADPTFTEIPIHIPPIVFLIKYFGPRLGTFMENKTNAYVEEFYYRPLAIVHEKVDRTIASSDVEIARCSAVPTLAKAKEENIDLQLEVAYRERVQRVHRTVYRYLSYHAEHEATQKRIQQKHLADWIVNQVIKGITPTQEKETLSHCISDLRRLAQIQKTASLA